MVLVIMLSTGGDRDSGNHGIGDGVWCMVYGGSRGRARQPDLCWFMVLVRMLSTDMVVDHRVWCLVCGVWCLVCGVWAQVSAPT